MPTLEPDGCLRPVMKDSMLESTGQSYLQRMGKNPRSLASPLKGAERTGWSAWQSEQSVHIVLTTLSWQRSAGLKETFRVEAYSLDHSGSFKSPPQLLPQQTHLSVSIYAEFAVHLMPGRGGLHNVIHLRHLRALPRVQPIIQGCRTVWPTHKPLSSSCFDNNASLAFKRWSRVHPTLQGWVCSL